MSAQRGIRNARTFTILSTLLMTSAFVVPALAQQETVVVTAEKRSADIQSVPIAVSAFGSQDLAAHQILGFKDLQFAIPSVTFSHGNFGPSNFQIRGIGSASVSTSGDAGVAINQNDFYLNAPPVTTATYYDVERVEVLRGPQSTLYGRNATGGSVNIISAKPDLDTFSTDMEGTIGNFADKEVRAMVNVPILEGELGLRVAGFWENRDGTITNIYPHLVPGSGVADKIDSRNDYSVRTSLRWEPSSKTTVDFMIQAGAEDDTRVRAQKQLCHRDPTGILGCLPDKLAFESINGNATLGTLLDSNIGPLLGIGNLYTVGQSFALFDVADPTNSGATSFWTGLPMGAPGMGSTAVVPHSLQSVSTDFTPTQRGDDTLATLQWKQDIFSWLSMTFLTGYDHNKGVGQESYNTGAGDPFSLTGPLNVTQWAMTGFSPTATSLEGATNLFCLFSSINCAHLTAGGPGTLPVSGVGNNGIIGGNVRSYDDHVTAFDQISGHNTQWSSELRFASNFDGPINFLIAGYHMGFRDDAEYYVNANTLDYFGNVFGGLTYGDGLVLGPTFYDNNNKSYNLTSNAVFGELYWDAIPDVLKFTGGLRYTADDKSFSSRQTLMESCAPGAIPNVTGVMPWGTTDWNSYLTSHGFDADNHSSLCDSGLVGDPTPGIQPYVVQKTSFSAYTGRFVADWTPDLDFTDKTLIYASYSRGYRSGGFNPPSFTGAFPQTFQPETIDSYEVGTKNTLPFLSGTLQANLTGWYYDYKNYQVSAIVDRTSVNSNINAKLWGVEGEFFFTPDDNWQFNMNFGYTHSSIGDSYQIDTRTPAQDAPGVTLLKDTQGANCVIVNTGGVHGGAALTPAIAAGDGAAIAGFLAAPPGGNGVSSPIPGVAQQAYFLYSQSLFVPMTCQTLSNPAYAGLFLPAGYSYASGVAVNLSGNEMPNTPKWTLSFGAQYTMPLDDDYNIVARLDYYWKDKQFGRIFNGPADAIKSWDVMNAQIQLNAPENLWYARAWVQNVFDKDNITGMYVTDPSSALFTNAFVGTPRTYGLTVGVHL